MNITKESNNYREHTWTVHMLPNDAPEGLAIHQESGDISKPSARHSIWLTKEEAFQLRAEVERIWPSDVPLCCGYNWRKNHTSMGSGLDGFLHRKGCAVGENREPLNTTAETAQPQEGE